MRLGLGSSEGGLKHGKKDSRLTTERPGQAQRQENIEKVQGTRSRKEGLDGGLDIGRGIDGSR